MEEVIKNNLSLIEEYPIFEIEYNRDGTKKEFFEVASEKDIKETQIKSDENELDFKYSQNVISKEEYEKSKKMMEIKLRNQNMVYDSLIFDMIKNEKMDVLKEKIKNAHLNDIDLKRLATSLSSIAEGKIDDFQKNNKDFKENDVSLWNYKYDVIARNYAKTRELESFILSLIE